MADATMTDAVRSDAAPNPAGDSYGGNGGSGGAGGGSGGGKGEKKKCEKCGGVHRPQNACWAVCNTCGLRHHYRAQCPRGQDPQRSLVEENRALHERIRVLELELAQVRGQYHVQLQITTLLQQQASGSMYSSPFSHLQPAMQPQALQASGLQPLAQEPPRATGSFSGFGRSKQMATSRSEPPQKVGSSRGGKGSEGGGDDADKGLEKKNEQPKKRAEDSKKRVEEMRKKQAEAKKQPADKTVPSSTPADNCDQAASPEGRTKSKTQRRRESRKKGKAQREQKQEEAGGQKNEGATEAMEVDEETQAPIPTVADDGGEEPNHSAAVSTLAIRERSSEREAGTVEPTVASQPQPQLPQQASEPADNSLPGVGGGTGAASGPSEPCQPEE